MINILPPFPQFQTGYWVEIYERLRYGYEKLKSHPTLKGVFMPSDRKIEGILMPMPVAFKNDGAIDQVQPMRSSIFIWRRECTGFFL